MARCIVPEAEAILDKEYKVLDKGFVRLVDYMGGDARIVQAARVSYGGGTKSFREDQGLIDYLLRNQHTSPFEQVNLTFHAKMPIFVARQWVRHRTAKLNEISGRYSVMKDEFYMPDPGVVTPQSSDNKQGRSGEAVDPEVLKRFYQLMEMDQTQSYEHYKEILDLGLARELARINLPLSLYTEWYWTIDLHNLFHFLRLRMDPHAQYEIRCYAEVMLEMTRKVAPAATASFEEHLKSGVKFSAREWELLKSLLPQELQNLGPEASIDGWAAWSAKEKERFAFKLKEGRQK